ncbi:MAG: ABC transporter ATP-binding protein [Bacteroidota bacterium]|nr:ABC transporter ATP-binding protein [Bacteroidota bacterium]
MAEPVITVESLSKRYVLYHHENRQSYSTLRDVVSDRVGRIFRGGAPRTTTEEFNALTDVSFEVNAGDRLGIIGRNGAGKSTLLKILSRIVSPTKGRITIDGRVASLLEVGTGFHAELSGRENIFLNGAILGMSRAEIKANFDEIVAFAEVERFIDTPVKRYSSGMYVRLAFAVAAHLDPEILIVDEVLAVGDTSFQKKCLGKMEDVAGQGRTVLFVSHNMETVLRLCNRAVLLENGRVKDTGLTEEVIRTYLNTGSGTNAQRSWIGTENIPGNEIVKLRQVFVHDEKGETLVNYDVTKRIGITMEYEVFKEGQIFTHSFNFFNEEGINIFDTHDTVSEMRRHPREKGIWRTTMWIPANLLAEGLITVGVATIKIDPFTIHFHVTDAVSFNVVDHIRGDSARGDYTLGFPGLVRPFCPWETIKLS